MGSKGSSQKMEKEQTQKPTHESLSLISMTPIVHSRVLLVWTRQQFSSYQCLSTNIIREICDYLGETPFVLTEKNRLVYQFNPATKQFYPFFEVTSLLSKGFIQNSALMGPNRVFIVLRSSKSAFGGPVCFAVYCRGRVRRFEDQHDRSECRVIYDKDRDCVYIFGGETMPSTIDTQYSARCQKFLPATGKFATLPEMLRGRSRFGVCWHFGLVYLCGGTHCSIEKFDPRTLTFSYCSPLDYSHKSECSFVAVSHRSEVIVISKSFLWTGRDGQWEKTQRKNGERDDVRTLGTPIVWDKVAYISDYNGTIGVDLETGVEITYKFRYAVDE